MEEHGDPSDSSSSTTERSRCTERNIGTPWRESTRRHEGEQRAHSRSPRREDIPKGARTKKPEPFEGKKRLQEAENFLMKMEVYFNDYGTYFTDDRRIDATLVNMKEGEATKWAKPLLAKRLAGTAHPALASWHAFKHAFLLTFGDPIKKERAIRDIGKLEQTRSTKEYATEFCILMDELDWDEKALIDKFHMGLKDNVQKDILRATFFHDTECLTLDQWIEFAIKTDDILFHTRSKEEKKKPFSRKAGEMEGEKKKALSDEEFKKRVDAGVCVKCKKKGHGIKKCYAKEWDIKPFDPKMKGKAAIDEKEEGSTNSESEN
ncbi:hypothetical protein FRC08_001062 [Ceratobasidium sp. 394]|nr:hypothetical protein FRC08_001062 [Ceratobasidium sp. 394]KAG9076230.1 hypothetical protein FS749_012019 [Ceratobasidium sp. UAMH 11750]